MLLDRLLDAATKLFLEESFDAISMGEISKLPHASTETFYRHFPTKEELFERVLLRRTELLKGELNSVLRSEDEPEKALSAHAKLERDVTSFVEGLLAEPVPSQSTSAGLQ